MNPRPLFVVFTVAMALEAQAPSSPIHPVGALQSIGQGCGLQADPKGDGLTGAGARYVARFRAGGVRFEAVLGAAAPTTQFVALSKPTVTRSGSVLPIGATAEPVAAGGVAKYSRAPGIEERFEVQPEGVELSWTFATRPAGEGDLVVRHAVETNLREPTAVDGGLAFACDYGGVRIGKVTGIDASGARVDGSVHWDGSGVRFTLPASFVDGAKYPIVLDPVLGTTVALGNISAVDTEPDAAYDELTDQWLVTFVRTVSATDVRWAVQFVSNATGLPIPLGFLVGNSGLTSKPRVVNHRTFHVFGIVVTQTITTPFTSHFVQLLLMQINSVGAISFQGTSLELSVSAPYTAADIGVRVDLPVGAPMFVVVYQNGTSVFARAANLSFVSPAQPLWTGTATTQFSEPAVSRAAGADGRLMAVAVRHSGASYAIVGLALDAALGTPIVGRDLVANTPNVLRHPDVDGFAGRWLVACEDAGGGLVLANVRVLTVTVDPVPTTINLGASIGFGGSLTSLAFAPRLGYAPGRTWLAYRTASGFGGLTSTMRVVALDSASCANCNDPFSVTVPNTSTMVVGTMTSGGVPGGETALCTWFDLSNHISAQRLQNFGTVGATTNLGGACGTTGAVAFNHAPGIGSSGFRCSLTGVPATALAAIFNFSAPAGTFPCGGCVWTPFSVTQSPPIAGGASFVEFPIPCLQSLIGQQFETQWSVIDFTQAPCVLFPGLALSNRTLLTIGN